LKLSTALFLLDPIGGLGVFKNTLKSILRVKKYIKNGYKSFSLYDLQKYRKSEILFLLGSGPSINELNKSDWDKISSNDSWGFNFWFCHDFIPKKYFLQSPISNLNSPEHLLALDNMMTKMLIDKREKYDKVKFFLRGDGVNNHEFHETKIGKTFFAHGFDYSFLPELIVSSKSRIPPKKIIRKMYLGGFFSKKNKLMPIPKFGSTITELISFGLINGYKKIILCGIDMNDGGHFYDSNQYYKKYKYLKVLSDTNNSKNIHEHMDKNTRKYTIKDIVLELNYLAKEKFGSEIFVSSSTSSLYPEIKKYEFGE
tara:strand:- start:552 stop:1487 length:936 start_codon:yes stop_codon:yes gene_type:complete